MEQWKRARKQASETIETRKKEHTQGLSRGTEMIAICTNEMSALNRAESKQEKSLRLLKEVFELLSEGEIKICWSDGKKSDTPLVKEEQPAALVLFGHSCIDKESA